MIIENLDQLKELQDEDGSVLIKEDCEIKCNVPKSFGLMSLYCRGNLDCRGYLNCRGEKFIIRRDLYWSHASIPCLPKKTYITRVLPQEWQRDYYQERLGIDLSEGCYNEICEKVIKKIVNLLRDDKWTPTELWRLEALRDSIKPVPDWVSEI